ncbi:hypothetical protein JXB41_05555 [Candidatus Woesearchaeota archaeon]|nr:hypothetical protein [Candidatus Woesearchaeota archaeon]
MKKKLLFIDLKFQELFAEYYALKEYDVITALDTETGLELILSEKPDLILINISGLDIEGCVFMRKLYETATEYEGEMPNVVSVSEWDTVVQEADFKRFSDLQPVAYINTTGIGGELNNLIEQYT